MPILGAWEGGHWVPHVSPVLRDMGGAGTWATRQNGMVFCRFRADRPAKRTGAETAMPGPVVAARPSVARLPHQARPAGIEGPQS